MSKFVKLPNGNIVSVCTNNRISVSVVVELSDLIDNDFAGVLDLLSEKATGTELLSDFSYVVTGNDGNSLTVKVSGSIDDIDDAEIVDADDLPMLEFEVSITRVGYGERTIRLSARTEEEAIDIADDDAGDHLYSEHNSSYLIEAQQITD